MNVPLIALLFAAFAVGCGSSDEGEELPEVDCNTVTVPKFSEVTGLVKCTICHASTLPAGNRQDAPLGYDYDTYEAASMDPTEAVEEVFKGSMPPADSNITLTDAEKQQLYAWGLCGNPM